MVKVVAVVTIIIVLLGSLSLVFKYNSINQKISSLQNRVSQPNVFSPNDANADPEQKTDLALASEVNSVDQVEASNIADEIALDPNQ